MRNNSFLSSKWRISVTSILISIVSSQTFAENKNFNKAQQNYSITKSLLNHSKSIATQQIVSRIAEDLKNYPLYPYLQFKLLNIDSQLSQQKIDAFIQKYPNLPPMGEKLTAQLYNQLFKESNWAEIIKLGDSKHPLQHCQYLAAQTKNFEKSTALFNEIATLWKTGDTVPAPCKMAIEYWINAGNLTAGHIFQKALLAFKQNHIEILQSLSQLATTLADEDNKNKMIAWLSQLQQLLAQPETLPQFIQNTADTQITENKQVILSAFPRFLRTVLEKDLTEDDPFSLFQTWAEKFKLNQEERKQWQLAVVNKIFDSDLISLQKWRDSLLDSLQYDHLYERRLRLAMREKQNWGVWLNKLSAATREKDEWQYWEAQQLSENNKPQEAQAIWKKLSKTRGGR